MRRPSVAWLAALVIGALAAPALVGAAGTLEALPDYWSGTWDTPFNKISWHEVTDAAGKRAIKDFPVGNGGNKAICPSQSRYFVGTYRNDDGTPGHHAACTSGEAVLGRFKDDSGGAPAGWYRAVVSAGDRCSFSGTFKVDGGDLSSWTGNWVSSEGASGGVSVCAVTRTSCGRRASLQACSNEASRTATAVVRSGRTSINADWNFTVIGTTVLKAKGTLTIIEPSIGGTDTTELKVYGKRKLARYQATDAANRAARMPLTVVSSDASGCEAGDAGTGTLVDSTRNEDGDAVLVEICGETLKFAERSADGRVTVTVEGS